VLRNSNKRRLVVRGSVDGRHAVGASRETTSDSRRELAIDGWVVQALEEHEDSRVGGRGLRQRGDLLDHDVRVTDDKTLRVRGLGRGEVVGVGVDKVTRVEIVDRHLNGEVGVGGDGREVRRVDELGRRHRGGGSDQTHGRRVTRTGLDLGAVGEREAVLSAEVDEVVGGRVRRDLTSTFRVSTSLTILLKARLDERRVQC